MLKITEILVKEGKLTSIRFVQDKQIYNTEVTSENITLRDKRNGLVAEYDIKTGESEWALRHCCGLMGFGGGLDDICYACAIPGSKLKLNQENEHRISVDGEFTIELNRILSTEIPEYCKKLEEQIKKI